MIADGDNVADCVLAAFDKLPTKFKPRVYPNGSKEWVPLAGIVLSLGTEGGLQCVSLGTGMRCLPASKLHLAQGLCLHDWHAEVVAIRAFNLFLIQECSRLSNNDEQASNYVRRRREAEISTSLPQPFTINDDVGIYMYCSEAPCGDASMELIMNAQADATPWTKSSLTEEKQLSGRGDFSTLGAVRRKPARSDAPPTLSKSCSDKLALKQCISLLSSVTSLLLAPSTAYLHELILPQSQLIPSAVARAFSAKGRMASLLAPEAFPGIWPGGYVFKPFEVSSTSREFAFSRRQVVPHGELIASNIAAMWTPQRQEVLIGGTVQGNKQFSVRGASSICRGSIWRSAMVIMASMSLRWCQDPSSVIVYADVKRLEMLDPRRKVKEKVTSKALCNWIKNSGDDDFALG